MKKKILSILITILTLCMFMFTLTACDGNEPPTPKYYTITWQNYDGSVLETDNDVKEGLMPTYDSATPTKERDAEFSYEFSGWSPEISAVTGNVTYVAQFNAVKNKYTVTWKDYDGTVLELDESVEYGTTPSFDGENPTREKDAQYTYTFSGWNPTVDSVTGNVEYVAQYSTTINKYTVTWKNYDGTVLETDTEVPYGTIPTYNGNTPTKETDAQYTYAFDDWDKTISAVMGDITYTARYTSLVNKYTVTWKNYDGTVLETDENVDYGTLPTYNGTTPTRERAEYTYTFIGWDKTISEVTGNVIYTAQYSQETSKFIVVWKNYDGTVLKTETDLLYQAMPEYVGQTPTREKDAQYTYTFNGWSPTISQISDDIVYTAQYSTTLNKYTVTWKNYDGTVLETDTEVPYGTIPSYNGNTPTKEKDAQYTYSFNGWDKTVGSVVGDITYTARYNNTINKYTITWKNYDGTILKTDSVAYGSKPSYTGTTPTKQGDVQYGYIFDGWSPSIVNVTGEAEYIATFSQTTQKYTVTWKNYDGTVLETDANVAYGSMPTYNGNTPSKPCDSLNFYTFERWAPNVDAVKGDTVYTAAFSISESTTFTIKYDANGGTGAPSSQTKNKGQNITLSFTIPTNGKYVFIGWDCADDGNTYSEGASFSLDANVTLYAVWELKCSKCSGSGWVDGTQDCPSCSGGTYSTTEWRRCSSCGGSGSSSIPTNRCGVCGGSGRTLCSFCSGTGIYYSSAAGMVLSCYKCSGGSISCSGCGGDGVTGGGTRTCNSCSGLGGSNVTVQKNCSSCSGRGYHYIEEGCSKCSKKGYVLQNRSNYTINLYDGSSKVGSVNVRDRFPYKIETIGRGGYTFIGWFDINGKQYTDRNGVSFSVWDETSNKTLYAQWIENYTITYNLDGGTASNKTSYNIEISTFTLNNPTRTGYTFIGWTGANGDVPELNVSVEFGTVGNLEFTANWAINQYSITLIFNNGREDQELEFYYQEDIVIDIPTWNRKSFDGWYEDENLTIAHSFTKMPNKNYTLYAKWETYDITISYDETKTAVSVNDVINAELFGATAIDTDETVLDVNVEVIAGQMQVGETITVRLTVTGLYNVKKVQTITDISIYGTPTLICDTTIEYINLSDELVGDLFSAIGTDTFGDNTNIVVSVKEGEYSDGDIVTIVVTAIDVTGNEFGIEVPNVKVYGTPIINRNEAIVDMKISEIISNEKFVVTATDSFGVPLDVTTEIIRGSFAEGNIITVRSSATDSKENIGYIDYQIKVYGLPTISNATMKDFKVEDEITLDALGIVAKDSFGVKLENVTLTLQNGSQTDGNVLTYSVVAVDHLGNESFLVVDNVRIFGEPIITYNKHEMDMSKMGWM